MLNHLLVPHRHGRALRPALRSWDDFDRLFDGLGFGANPAPAGFEPRIDVREDDDEIRVRAELPGLEEKDFGVVVEGDRLTIKGEKRDEQCAEGEGRRRVESRSGSFRRVFRLPWEVDAATVKAVYKHGVLTVTVPKPEEVKPQVRTIPVSTN